MAAIICYRCFATFAPHEVRFKCAYHKVDDEHLGINAPLIFDAPKRGWLRRTRTHAPCPRDTMLSGFRVCPRCHHDVPYHAGRSRQRIIAVVGCQGAGKTLYLWSLLYRLREQLAREEEPFVTPMFEDDASFDIYQRLNVSLLEKRVLPEMTQSGGQKQFGILPVTVRLLGGRGRAGRLSNLVLYDPSGELVESLTQIRFLRYLDHAAGIIYLVEPADPSDAKARQTASEGLSHIVTHLRQKDRGQRGKRIQKTLAVVMTKADEHVFGKHGQSKLVPGGGKDPDYWKHHSAGNKADFAQSNDRCREVFRERGHNNLLAIAERSFVQTAYFAVSSLGGALTDTGLTGPPAPVGVEHPLFWSMHTLG